MAEKGRFIVFEGIDGSGKTTVAKRICGRLGNDAVFTSEPHDPAFLALAEGLQPFEDADSVAAKALTFTADRAVHTRQIREWLSGGRHVICDRYFLSTIAYQSAEAAGASMKEWIRGINAPFSALPDAVIYLDSEPSLALGRIGGRNSRLRKYEKESFLNRVRQNYLGELAIFKGRKFIIGADVHIDSLERESLAAVMSVVGGQ